METIQQIVCDNPTAVKTFTYFVTERHGYVETTMSFLRKLKISKLISPYSKHMRGKVYIEEDGDLRLFLNRLQYDNVNINLKEDYSRPQEFFDNLPRLDDHTCTTPQFDKFKKDYTLDFKCHFSKISSIKHVRDGIFQTKDGKQIKIYPTVYLEGKPLTPAQAKKLGFEPISIETKDLEEYYD